MRDASGGEVRAIACFNDVLALSGLAIIGQHAPPLHEKGCWSIADGRPVPLEGAFLMRWQMSVRNAAGDFHPLISFPDDCRIEQPRGRGV